MTATWTTGQWARIPVLLALLWATAPPLEALSRAVSRLDEQALWLPWLSASVLGMAFVVVMLAGRRQQHSWGVLAVEAVVAAIVAFVPPAYWVMWGGIWTTWIAGLEPWALAMGGGFAQPLAMAWLGVVGLRVVQHLRGAPEAGPGTTSDPSVAAAER